MSTYPKTLQEAIIFFSDKERAHTAMVALRWPEDVTCGHCGSDSHSFNKKRFVYQCRSCRKQFTVKTGTLMEDSPLGLDKWLSAMWLVANCKNGVSSCEVSRALGITQKSAWFLDHRIRMAMHQGNFDKLSGTVEVDETFVGGKARNMHADKKAAKIKGRGTVGKTIVLGLLERKRTKKDEKGKSKVHVTVIQNREKATLHPLVREHVEPGTHVMTDEHAGYPGMDEYAHSVINHAEKYVDGIIHTNGMENFWSLFKRAITGTYVSCEPFHLFRYADEEAFKYNEREGNDQDRFRKLAAGIAGKRLTYKTLTGKTAEVTEPG